MNEYLKCKQKEKIHYSPQLKLLIDHSQCLNDYFPFPSNTRLELNRRRINLNRINDPVISKRFRILL